MNSSLSKLHISDRSQLLPTVSVCMITYNHEKYISQAIEGVLMQETEFEIELVIGDDCSTDRTGQICESYEKRFPATVKLIKHNRNLGVSENFRRTINKCSGKYIAICEGDDFWTDPRKLSKQVEFLDSNPGYTMCFHKSILEFEDGRKINQYSTDSETRDFSFDDFIERKVGVGTQTMLFRRDILPEMGDGFLLFDWVLFLIISYNGKVRFSDEVMSVYRRHNENWTNHFSTRKAEFFLALTTQMKKFFEPSHSETFDRWLAHCHADICFGSFDDNDADKFERSFENCNHYWQLLSRRKKVALVIRKQLFSVPGASAVYKALRDPVKKIAHSYQKRMD